MIVDGRRRLLNSPYAPVLKSSVFRRFLPGFIVSSLGDGMAVVAVGWLAIDIAPVDHRGLWVALAVSAYTLPGALGAMVFGRFLRDRRPAQLVRWDATLRAAALACIPLAYAIGHLDIAVYVVLLAFSSLLHSWGQAGIYAWLASLLPPEEHLAGNALLSMIGSMATVFGPMLAGALIVFSGPVTVLAVDAASFVALMVTFGLLLPPVDRSEPTAAQTSRLSGLAIIRADPQLAGVLTMSFVFFFLFGPVYVALPLHLAETGQGAGAVAAFYTAFGVGAMLGSFAAGYLGRWPSWPILVGIVVGFGLCLLPVGLGAPHLIALVAFGLGGMLWPPYSSISTTLIQRSTTPDRLAEVLAASSAIRVLAVPSGSATAGPLVALLGAAGTMLFSGVGIVLTGLIAVLFLLIRKPDRTRTEVDHR